MRRVIHLISWGLGVSVLAAQNNESPEALLDALLPDAEKIEEFDHLVDKLGADDFKVRKKAMDLLLEASPIAARGR